MRGLRFLVCFMLAGLFLASARADYPNPAFKVGADLWEPFFTITVNNDPAGLAYDILFEAMTRTGQELEITYYPNRRLRMLFQRGELDMLLLDSPEWIEKNSRNISLFSVPVLDVREHAYVATSLPARFDNPEDFKGLSIAVSAGYQYPVFDPFIENGEITFHEIEDVEALPLMVSSGRADAFFMDEFLFAHMVKSGRITPGKFKKVMTLSSTSLAFRLHTRHQSFLFTLNATLNDMKSDGSISKMLERYF